MIDNDTKRLSRLAAILTQLQAKRLLTAKMLAEKFDVTTRTIYRDIKALEQAGVPVLTEEGKGYSLMEGYRLPPIMLTESEANALITAEQFILNNKDESLATAYAGAINKIKAVLNYVTKDKADLLSNRIVVKNNYERTKVSTHLSQLQLALTNFNPVKIEYLKSDTDTPSERIIEPFFLYHSTQENWLIVAFCRMRKDFRAFRLDRIHSLVTMSGEFEPHKMTISQYFKNHEVK
ncbi:YafY family transcriptional regulator [Chitinophaga sp. 2R12]|uniref:YafY family transcriptional regulator n=2 Tax=Chitinophagaceae TaxID=563835 RepID=A0ABS5J9N8_9BACT|nr:YafY family transcriptional regulator [Chitinophaga hostae]